MVRIDKFLWLFLVFSVLMGTNTLWAQEIKEATTENLPQETSSKAVTNQKVVITNLNSADFADQKMMDCYVSISNNEISLYERGLETNIVISDNNDILEAFKQASDKNKLLHRLRIIVNDKGEYNRLKEQIDTAFLYTK